MGKSLAKKEEKEARESRLHLAIEHDDVDELHNLIVEEPELLDRISKHPFPNTPLHIAAAAGKIDVAMELAILKPSFTRKLNPEGYSPMHLALQHEQYHIVRALMTTNPRLIRVRGRGGITPLHFVAQRKVDDEKENEKLMELLAEFLVVCKSSIEDLTNQYETAVHVAVKNHNLEAFEVFLIWLRRVREVEILNWKDKDGNTVLHIAASENQPKIIKLLTPRVDIDVRNFQNKTALEIFQGNSSGDEDLAKRFRRSWLERQHVPKIFLLEFLRKEPTCFEQLKTFMALQTQSARETILIVATLVAIATYQAALTPPGGYWQDNSLNAPANSVAVTANSSGIAVEKPHQAGNMILAGSRLYMFTVLNSLVFFISIIAIWITSIPQLPHTLTVYLLMIFLSNSYLCNLAFAIPKSTEVPVSIVFLGFYFISLAVGFLGPFSLWIHYSGLIVRIKSTGRRVATS
ncbi:hypothetical protein BT93_L1577 [Corymbia citriodora subsp. variegata]|uniref:PGG domain-containing protein n=1 Tax=Corymbia citriodora subsp. variegata TaxID=360336 RepID=A0A8T0CPQ2_CORYI|nr:hypothetical protein BT93_L1577 [Corymbia citriodora subsp. variegata]